MHFTCRAVELDFLDSAAWRFDNVVELDAPPGEVFDIFADGESWPKWFDAVQRITWTSPEPKGVGTTRTVTLAVTPLKVTVQERFLVWDPGQRFTFRFEGVGLPLFHAGIEDYRLQDLSGGRCALTYTVCLEPTAVVRLAGPVTRPLFARMLRTGAQGLKSYVAASPHR
jgi:uncharacterized protein YndB with AHSA1/START domain